MKQAWNRSTTTVSFLDAFWSMEVLDVCFVFWFSSSSQCIASASDIVDGWSTRVHRSVSVSANVDGRFDLVCEEAWWMKMPSSQSLINLDMRSERFQQKKNEESLFVLYIWRSCDSIMRWFHCSFYGDIQLTLLHYTVKKLAEKTMNSICTSSIHSSSNWISRSSNICNAHRWIETCFKYLKLRQISLVIVSTSTQITRRRIPSR